MVIVTSSLHANDLEAAERTFRKFLVVSHTLLCAVAVAMWLGRESDFWHGNILWTLGSMSVAVSVIQTRFFNILKMANPNNRVVGRGLATTWRRVESVVNLYWILGFCFIALSRWLKW